MCIFLQEPRTGWDNQAYFCVPQEADCDSQLIDACQVRTVSRKQRAMINEGVFLSVPTSNHIYMSFAHSDDDFEQILTTTETVLNKYEFTDVCDAK